MSENERILIGVEHPVAHDGILRYICLANSLILSSANFT